MEVNFRICHYWHSPCAMKGVKMIVFVCIDDQEGMMFNHRRLSQDRRLREYILELTAGGRLWMNAYSREQFPEDAHVCTDENFLSRAAEGELCFVEDQELSPFRKQIERIILFCWNRSYPADFHFDRSLLEGRKLVFTEEFQGFSHEMITREDYE